MSESSLMAEALDQQGRAGSTPRLSLQTPKLSLQLCHIELVEANEYITTYHRHHGRVQGHRFSLGARFGDALVGIIVVGRPVGGQHQKDWTEATRCCTDGTP